MRETLTPLGIDIYGMVCKRAGIDVYIHPEVNSRRIHVELNGVTLGEALTAIAVESKTVWRPLTSSTISVQNSPEREKREPSPAVRFVPISPA
jgi:general secretion pathway protein D